MAAPRSGNRVGYIRVSSVDQNQMRQLEGLELDRRFTDKASVKDRRWPQRQAALEYLRDGDVLVIHSMDRLARNHEDLRKIVMGLTERGVVVKFVKERLTFTNEDRATAKLLLSVIWAFAEFERSLTKERQRECIALAKKPEVHGGLKPFLGPEQAAELRTRVAAGEKRAALAREFRISRRTLYEYAPVAALPSVISRLQIQQRLGEGLETPGADI